jgi:hypothetical protein
MSTSSLYSGLIAQIPPSIVGNELDNLTAILNALQSIFDSSDTEAASSANYAAMFSVSIITAVDIPSKSWVTVDSSGSLIPATQQGVLGYTQQGSKAGESTTVIMEGVVTNEDWVLVPGTTYFLGLSGELVTTPQLQEDMVSTVGAYAFSLHIRVGVAVTPNSLLICPTILGKVLAFSI